MKVESIGGGKKKKMHGKFFKKGLEYRQFQALTSWNRSTKAVKAT